MTQQSQRIQQIFEVKCKVHKFRPIDAFQMSDEKLKCSECRGNRPISGEVPISIIWENIIKYQQLANQFNEFFIQKIESIKQNFETFLNDCQSKILVQLQKVKQLIIDFPHRQYLQANWFTDDNNGVDHDSLQRLCNVWRTIFDYHDGECKIRSQYSSDIEILKTKISQFQELIVKFAVFANEELFQHQKQLSQTIYKPRQDPISQISSPKEGRFQQQIMRLEKLLDKQVQFDYGFSICYFKVKTQCKLLGFAMPPTTSSITLIFRIHKDYQLSESIYTQTIEFLCNSDPSTIMLMYPTLLNQNKYYTLSLQLEGQQAEIMEYYQNSFQNEYIEFINEPEIYSQWEQVNKNYYRQGLFSTLIIEI
ncbi:hypothetical protein pb186bvf_013197 [Paramecium bursaria]